MKINGASNVIFTPAEIESLSEMLGGALDWDLHLRKIVNLANPVGAQDAANKSYVDDEITARLATSGLGTVTNISSANSDIGIANPSTTPTLTLNAGTAGGAGDANKVAKLSASGELAPAMIPSLDTAKLTAGTLPIARGGTGLSPVVADANRVYGIDSTGTASELKSIIQGSGVTVTHGSGTITIAATGAGGTVTNVGVAGLPLSITNPSTTPSISIAQSNTTTAGYLSAADWNTFNGKQPAGSYMTEVSGHPLAQNQVWMGNASNQAASRFIGLEELRNASGIAQLPVTCTAAQSLMYNTVSDVLECTNIAIASSAVTGLQALATKSSVDLSTDDATGTLPVSKGGTGVVTLAQNRLLVGNGTGAVTSATAITASRALVSDTNGVPTHSVVTSTELGYVSGVTANIQAQLNAKQGTLGTGAVTSSHILDGEIMNADIGAAAAIVDTKLATISTAGKVSNSATTATNLNTASTIVARDPSGNFTAGTITANAFSGSGASITSLNASNLSSGTVATARLGSGTADGTTFLRGDGTWAAVAGGGGGATRDYQVFTTSGTWSKPTGADMVFVECWGAGGSGGKYPSPFTGLAREASGGGGGGYSGAWFLSGDLPSSVPVTVATAPAGRTSVGAGTAGGASAFGTYLTANGGLGGNSSDSIAAGGSATIGANNISWQPERGGSSGTISSTSNCAMGCITTSLSCGTPSESKDKAGAAGGSAAGYTGGTANCVGGNSIAGGGGGNGNGNGNAQAGVAPGGGGGASTGSGSSGAGARGECRVTTLVR